MLKYFNWKKNPALKMFLLLPLSGWAASSTRQLEAEVLKPSPTVETKTENREDAKSEEVAEDVPPPEASVEESSLHRLDQAILGPTAIPQEHIFVVHRRFIQKEGMHEVTPLSLGIQPADSFQKQIQWSFSYTYHLSEMLGLELLHVALINNYSTGLEKQIQNAAGVRVDRSESLYSLGSAITFTPMKAKVATPLDVNYFEAFFLMGAGTTRYDSGYVAMVMEGVGFRLYLTPHTLLKTEFRNYSDLRGRVENRPNLLFGFSLLGGL